MSKFDFLLLRIYNPFLFLKKVLIVLGVIVFINHSSAAQNLPRALLLTGNGNVPEAGSGRPPWVHEFYIDIISEILKDIVSIDVTNDLEELNLENLANYDLLISYSLFLTPNNAQLDAIDSFIASGNSFLTIHCGILSLLNWQKYEELIGGIFIGGPSIEPARFNVSTTNMEFWGYDYKFRNITEHPVSKAVDDFIIEDELYSFQPSSKEFYVIARAENHPVMWWHPFGNGRVMCLTLGHSREAMQTEGYQQLLRNGTRWLMGYPLIESIQLAPLSNRFTDYTDILDLSEITYLNEPGIAQYMADGSESVSVHCKKNGKVDLNINGIPGKSNIIFKTAGASGKVTSKEVEVTIVKDGEGNIAAYNGNKVQASSTEAGNILFHPNNVIDGNPDTRWSSDFVDPSWIQIDLLKDYFISQVDLYWEASYALNYVVEVSQDGNLWLEVAKVSDSDGEHDQIIFDQTRVRYIKVTGSKRSRSLYGYSLFEIEVYKN